MNPLDTLSFESTDEEGNLWFRLFVNGKDLAQEIQGEDGGIHYAYVEGDLPTWPPFIPCDDSISERMISVCSCGEYGCGSTRCIVDKRNHEVVFRDFDGIAKDAPSDLEFRFSRGNYDEVINEISRQAIAYREKYNFKLAGNMESKAASTFPKKYRIVFSDGDEADIVQLSETTWACPVCGCALSEQPYATDGSSSLDICASCMVTFGYDDCLSSVPRPTTPEGWKARKKANILLSHIDGWKRAREEWLKKTKVTEEVRARLANIGVSV